MTKMNLPNDTVLDNPELGLSKNARKVMKLIYLMNPIIKNMNEKFQYTPTQLIYLCEELRKKGVLSVMHREENFIIEIDFTRLRELGLTLH